MKRTLMLSAAAIALAFGLAVPSVVSAGTPHPQNNRIICADNLGNIGSPGQVSVARAADPRAEQDKPGVGNAESPRPNVIIATFCVHANDT